MGGIIWTGPDYAGAWSASGGLTDWVVSYLISVVHDAGATAKLTVILDNSLGMVNVHDFSPAGREQILRHLADGVVDAVSREDFSTNPLTGPPVVDKVRELAQLAAAFYQPP